MRPTLAFVTLVVTLLAPLTALASSCFAFVDGVPGIRYAQLQAEIVSDGTPGPLTSTEPAVTIQYVGHSTFRITSPEGLSVNTDYFGMNGPGGVPDVVTMNRAHETHYTDFPDPEIRYVLRGWQSLDGTVPAVHDLEIEDLRVRNVTTDIRSWGELGRDGNSIFVFEVAGLCIGHLGHLHHVPTEQQYAALGRMDILMVPVDGSFTMSVSEMTQVANRLKSSIVLPMHYFGRATLERFLAGMSAEFALDLDAGDRLEVAIDTLPPRPTVMLLAPRPR
ncbi:MAG: MBL fold metallo-hydrolase [Pikeienuella sp.]